MLKQCVLSVATLEVMLNSYSSVPPCEWMDSLSTEMYEVSCRQRFYRLFPSCLRSSSPVLLFVPPCLRSTGPSSTRCVSGAVSLALCSISVGVLYASTSGPDVTQQSVNWTFPALWGITCCCVTTARSTDFILCIFTIWCLILDYNNPFVLLYLN